ncbi:hypothetical protein [Pseudalkalibacillus berkeleyi]|uniref:Uncharacterized protein n=1 Tax=Pseudalkalibacillus berkeleyi TaxID=1069813 RepID=A0ABS9H1E3_9BACL|nr:hypothetical protein [Pseudalkalibacillus berkeleyi]MCF6137721.1 hypothetical protein [Pseudalkalibacillus berkeleyi]
MNFHMIIGMGGVFINIIALILLISHRKYPLLILLFVLLINHQYIGFLGFWGNEKSLIFIYYVLLMFSIVISIYSLKPVTKQNGTPQYQLIEGQEVGLKKLNKSCYNKIEHTK